MKNINLSGSAIVLMATALVLSACRGVPTAGEKAQRKELETVTSTFRPEGMKPNLPVLTTNSELKAFVEYALLNNPSVEVAYFDWVASVERITSARSLPDPQLTFQMDIENIVSSVMPGLMVNLPGPGKLRAGAEVATAESEGRYQAFQSAVLESAFAVKRGYYQLYFLREKIRVSQENLKLLTTLEELARAQNEVGKVTLQDVLRAQIEQDRLRTEISNLEDSQNTVAARFNAALGRKPDADLILPGKIEAI